MREIKFRAWDKKNHIMYDRVQAGCNQQNISFVCHSVWDKDLKEWVHFDDYCGDLMQYTGLTDKNGVEIFESDILGGIIGGYVIYIDKQTRFGIDICGETNECRFEEFEQNDLEVIGNIYDNPELLEAQPNDR